MRVSRLMACRWGCWWGDPVAQGWAVQAARVLCQRQPLTLCPLRCFTPHVKSRNPTHIQLMHTFYDCYIWISINFKVRKLKLENFHILSLKCMNFIHSFNNMFWGTHFVLGSVWDMQVSCTDRAAFSGTGSSTFDGVLRTVDFYVIQLTTLWTN